eukprot:TRINITY_DN5776_c0_g1_i1.p1 TRINITY_DN5776_c0_g1~~TRINITY_DN5776_c0_g1_i1.p1  ORF type:complete len:345 (-),score=84.59 TRINITY_DN5776_c0_g1_i1:154-1188(-)
MCGHIECNLTTALCCWCGDKRPYAQYYEGYVDGHGYRFSATRHQYYCPTCKLKGSPNTTTPSTTTTTTTTTTVTTPRVSTTSTSSNRKPVIPKAPTPSHEFVYSKNNPYCPHSIYPTRCCLCPVEEDEPDESPNNNNNNNDTPLTKLPTCVHNICYKDCRVCSVSDEEGMIQMFQNMGFFRPDILTAIEQLYQTKRKVTPEAIIDAICTKTPPPFLPPPVPAQQPSSFLPTIQTQAANSQPFIPSVAQQPLAFPPPSFPSPALPPPSAPPVDLNNSNNNLGNSNNNNRDDMCIICFNETICACNVPCGHMGMCYTCAQNEFSRTGSCLICRSKVAMVVKVFKVV